MKRLQSIGGGEGTLHRDADLSACTALSITSTSPNDQLICVMDTKRH